MKSTKVTVIYLLVIIFAMSCLVAASVPIYNLFCKVTGYSGTARGDAAESIGTRDYRITFNTDIPEKSDLQFTALQKSIKTKAGKNNLVVFEFKNNSDQDITTVTLYNVLPNKAAQYFAKIECFCYDQITFKAGSTTKLPVSFYLDPAIEEDPFLKNIDKITLSYSIAAQN